MIHFCGLMRGQWGSIRQSLRLEAAQPRTGPRQVFPLTARLVCEGWGMWLSISSFVDIYSGYLKSVDSHSVTVVFIEVSYRLRRYGGGVCHTSLRYVSARGGVTRRPEEGVAGEQLHSSVVWLPYGHSPSTRPPLRKCRMQDRCE